MRFEADISLPPSANNAYVNLTGHGRFPSQKHKDWKFTAGWELQACSCPKHIRGPYRFTILLPTKMRGDVDNRVKLAMDLLKNLGITPDDRHAVSSHAERSADIPKGRCRIIVEDAEK